MNIHWGNLHQGHWLWLVLVCLAVAILAGVARRRAQVRFTTANLLANVLPQRGSLPRHLSTALVLGTLVLMVAALADVRWGKVWREIPQKGLEVMFVLDVSRSMLAEDATPNRLIRAKQQIKDTIDAMAGDRVGLVVFAGEARQQIPLTTHYDDFKQMLDEVGPHDLRRGGSRLGEAIETAARSFLTKSNDHKAMVIFTDGDDQQSQPIEAARHAQKATGVRIFTVGLGDVAGSRIPVGGDDRRQYLTYDGQPVWSKLHGDTLRQVATATGGAYIPAGTRQVDMSDVYHQYIARVEPENWGTARVKQYEARYRWFLLPALLLLLLDVAITTGPPVGRSAHRRAGQASATATKHHSAAA